MTDKLKDELFKIGHILPVSDEEIEEFDKVIKKKELPKLPEIFSTPSELTKDKSSKIFSIKPKNDNHIASNYEPMARVAREGKVVPEEILARMKKDRLDAEKRHKKDPS